MPQFSHFQKKADLGQMVALLESSSKSQRESLLLAIQSEDASRAALLKSKMLTLEKIWRWNPGALQEALKSFSLETLMAACFDFSDPKLAFKTLATIRSVQFNTTAVEVIFSQQRPDPGQVEAARIQIISHVRELERSRQLNLQEIDPTVSLVPLKVA